MRELAVLTELLGGSPLSRAARAGDLAEDWFPRAPTSIEGWRARIAATTRPSGWLRSIEPAFNASGPTLERLRAAAERGVLVTTGQQPGLFGGPLYTLYKALTADAIARSLEQAIGLPVCPVFWAATDDADFAEASVVTIVGSDAAVTLQSKLEPVAGTPMADAPLGDVSSELAVLVSASGSGASGDFIDVIRSAYSPDHTIGSAYVAFMRAILASRGIPVLDASHATIRSASDSILRSALQRATEVDRAVRERSEAIRSAGFEPQVEEVNGLSLVFANERGVKRRVMIAEASAVAGRADARLSPTVLLRPVVERAILPTVAYVGGPGEISYFAQASAVANALDQVVPLAVPRWSGTIVEPRVASALEKLGADVGELARPEAVEGRWARQSMPSQVARGLQDLRDSVSKAERELQDAGVVPAPVIEGAARDFARRLDRLERRHVAAMKRRNDEIGRMVRATAASLYPLGVRQERKIAFAQMVARYGETLLTALQREIARHADSLTKAESSRDVAQVAR